MVNVKIKSFLELVLDRFFDTYGLGRTLKNTRRPYRTCSTWAQSSRNRPESAANPAWIRHDYPHSGLRDPRPTGLGGCPCPCISQNLFIPLQTGIDSRPFL